MNFTQLRYFLTVAQTRNMSRASMELRVAQPAISRQIKLLEDELGTALLARHHRGVELTEAGTLLHQRSEFLVRMFEEMRTEVMELAAGPTGQLRLGCAPSLTLQFVGRALERFLRLYPKVRVHVQESISGQLSQAVMADQLDVAIVSTLTSEPNLVRTVLYSEAIWLFGPPGALKRRSPISLAAVAKLPLVLAMPNNSSRDLLDRRMGTAGLAHSVVVETDSTPLVFDLIRKGLGYAAAPFAAFYDSVEAGIISGAPIEDLCIQRSLVRRMDRPETRAMQAFFSILQDELALLQISSSCDLSSQATGGRPPVSGNRRKKRTKQSPSDVFTGK